MKKVLSIVIVFLLSGCSVVGENGVESAPYSLISADESLQIEIRNYDSMILVSTRMSKDGENSAFRKLFKYITGANEGAKEIAMTAPVFMDDQEVNRGVEIAMTAPVFMDESESGSAMSFVMPNDFTLQSTPKPTDPDVWISEVKDYKVAAIQFSGTLSDSNVAEYTQVLTEWMNANGHIASSQPITAGYNGPLTIPMFRRNEVLIEIQ